MHKIFACAFALSLLANAAGAQETRLGEEGFVPPPGQIEQLDWLVGQWEGVGIAGAPARESWLAPSGGTMVGSFVQEQVGEDGRRSILFTEHMYISETEGSLVLLLKHFNADLTGWEDRDEMVSFRLLALEPCAAYFHALTLRCADPDNPGSGLVAAVRMRSDSAQPRELTFRFEPTKPRKGDRCEQAATTVKMSECLAQTLEAATDRQVIYRQAAIERHGAQPGVMGSIIASDKAHRAYLEHECGGVDRLWREGSIRYTMGLVCKIALIDQRTQTIWQNWLTYMDDTPPDLPEPLPTR